MIKRDKYLQQLINARENGFPKVITGIRRCGKSYLLREIYSKYLRADRVKKDHIIIMDLDEDRYSKYRDPVELGEYIRSLCADRGMYYIFLDEIQRVFTIINPVLTGGKHVIAGKEDKEVISFVDVVLGLSREKNIDLYVTGSNSRMLSSDIITTFRDKATNIRLAPISFLEFHEYTGGSAEENLYSYMQYGGMPLAVLRNDADKREYLKNLFETTYFADILERNHLKKTEALEELCNIVSTLTGELLNAEKIANTFKSVRHEDISADTVKKYIDCFVDAFILREAKRYDLKGRKEIGALRKYYFCDTGLRNARLNFAFPDEGQMLENIVYNELMYQGFTVNVGTFESIEKNSEGKSIRITNEIDFLAKKEQRYYDIHVTADLSNARTRERELRPFFLLNDQAEKILIVNKPIRETRDENGFTLIGMTDFLLRFINSR